MHAEPCLEPNSVPPTVSLTVSEENVLGVEWWHPCGRLVGYEVQYGSDGALQLSKRVRTMSQGGAHGTGWTFFLHDMQALLSNREINFVSARVRVRFPNGRFSAWSSAAHWPEQSCPVQAAAEMHDESLNISHVDARDCDQLGRNRSASPSIAIGNSRAGNRSSSHPPLVPESVVSGRERAQRARSAAPPKQRERVDGGFPPKGWNLIIGAPPQGFFSHQLDPGAEDIFQCIYAEGQIVGLLAEPDSEVVGLVVTSPGAGGGPGPLDPHGGGGGGTYGGYNAYRELAVTLPRLGIAVLLVHYPEGHPGPRGQNVALTIDHMETLTRWYLNQLQWQDVPTAMIGWSMGGAVVIETAARLINAKRVNIRGVATIASQAARIQCTSPQIIIRFGAELLLMVGSADTCLAPSCSDKIGRMAGIKPEVFDGEDHGVKSALGRLTSWLPEVLLRRSGSRGQTLHTFAAAPRAVPDGVLPQRIAQRATPQLLKPVRPPSRPASRRDAANASAAAYDQPPAPEPAAAAAYAAPQPELAPKSGRTCTPFQHDKAKDRGRTPPRSSRREGGMARGRTPPRPTSSSSNVRPRQVRAAWDPGHKSPDISIGDDDLLISCPSSSQAPWHAAFLHTSVGLNAGLRYARFDFLVQEVGGGLIELGLVTQNKAKRAALHWPGLKNTSAWTYASSGCRFWNVPGADEDTWCQPFGEPYGNGAVVSLELDGGSLRFYLNDNLQGAVLDSLPVGNVSVGATLGPGSVLRLLESRVQP